jgi:DNA-binding transcriptional LysR family regulator
VHDPDPAVLRILVDLARQEDESGHASLGTAARNLQMAQPNVSRAVKAFEAEWGVHIVQRSPSGSRLGPDGRVVAGLAAQVLADYRNLTETLAALHRRTSSTLRISASLTIAEYVLPPILLRFRQHHPTTRPTLRMQNSRQVLDAVRGERADLGFVETRTRPRGVHYRSFDRDDLVIVALPDHPLAMGPALSAADLAGLPLIVRERGSGTREVIDAAVPGGASVAAELTSSSAVKTAAATGAAPAAISRRAVAEQLRTGALVVVPTAPEVALTRPLRVVWARGRRPTDAAQAFLQEVLGTPV